MAECRMMAWAIKWRSENRLDGKTEHLMGLWPDYSRLANVSGYHRAVFRTRQQARDFNNKHNGYIRNRPDLQREPHGWKMPIVVKVSVTVAEAGAAA